MTNKILLALLLTLPILVKAQVTQVTLWEPLPGKSDQMMETAARGVEISKKLGLQPALALDTHGRLHYITSFKRQALHAYYLSFIHPIKKEKIEINSKLPSDFNSLLNKLKTI